MNGRARVNKFLTVNRGWPAILMGMALATAPIALPAQVSLATVVDLAQRNSSAVRIASADVQKAQAELAETKDVFVPAVDMGSGLPAFPAVGFTGGVASIVTGTVQSTVFSLPQNQYIRAARAGLKAAALNLKDAREQVALDASTAYIELDTVNRELDAARQQEEFAAHLVAIEQQRAEAGVDPLNDLLQARLTAAELKLRRIHLEARAQTLSKQLSTLTGLPGDSITPDRVSIPEIPAVRADGKNPTNLAIQSAEMMAISKHKMAIGDSLNEFLPQMSFNALYSRNTTILNDFNSFYNPNKPIPTNNFSSGFSIQIPIFDLRRGAKSRESAADALRAKVEVEQAQRQSEVQIAELTGSLRELDALEEVASLKQQIAQEQIKAIGTQMEFGNGSGSGAGAQPQMTPKDQELARIDERQKFQDALDAGFDLSKARLNLLRALGHMDDWLHELHGK